MPDPRPTPGSTATTSRGAGGTVSGDPAPRYQWPTALVLALMLLALVIVATDHFRRGSVLFASAVVLAFFLRAILGDAAGWLAVRSRTFDLVCLGALGIGLTVFALVVPPPS